MSARRIVATPASEVQLRNPPTCDVCRKMMWWHGSTLGFGCPTPGDARDCQASPEQRHPRSAKAAANV